MIKIATPAGNGKPPRVLLGLSEGNLERLRAHQPILLDVDQCAQLGLGQRELVIFWGTDEVAMTEQLEHYGLVPDGAARRLREEFAKRESAR